MTATADSPFWTLIDEQLEGDPAASAARARLQLLAPTLPEPAPERRPLMAAVLAHLLLGSPFLCRLLMRDPQALDWVTERGNWSGGRGKRVVRQHLGRHLAERADTTGEAAWMERARRFRAREIMRIAARDLMGLSTVAETTAELSALADVVLEAACQFAVSALESAYGPMEREASVRGHGFAVLGLGKLGAYELNFSSDVDLMFLYCHNGTTGGGVRGTLDNQEWAAKAGQAVTRLVERPTDDGRLFRVDLRLRPEGNSGPLAFTPPWGLHYYETRAGPWEHVALLRARHVAGDLSVSRLLLSGLRPKLYRRRVDRSVVQAIREVKRQIAADLDARRQPGFDVKLGRGGVREIEFLVHTLQILHGGEDETLRTTRTLQLLERLHSSGLLEASVAESLRDDYCFLRRIEHLLQMHEDQQTHLLPSTGPALEIIALRMGNRSASELEEHLFALRERVHLLFLSLFAEEQTKEEAAHRDRIAEFVAQTVDAVDLEKVRFVLTHWPIEQLRALEGSAVEDGFRLLARVTTRSPVHVSFVRLGPGRHQIRVAALDITGLASVSTGVLAASGFDIVEGHLVTIPPCNAGGRHVGAMALQFLSVRRSERALAEEGVTDVLVDRLTELATRFVKGEREVVRQEVSVWVVESLRRHKQKGFQQLLPIDLELDNSSDPKASIVDVWAEDTPGFLWGFTQALAMRGIQVHDTRIRTDGGRAIDRFRLTDRNGRKIITAAARHELEVLAVLIKGFSQFLTRAADPAGALIQFNALLDRLGQEALSVHVRAFSTEGLLATLAIVLGSGTHLFEDFLRLDPAHLLPVLVSLSGDAMPAPMPPPSGGGLEDRHRALMTWRDAELFRVDCEHLLAPEELFGVFAEKLSRLADSVVTEGWRLAIEETAARYGWPKTYEGGPIASAVFALGKFGGRELGFGSDLEILVVYGQGGSADSSEATSADEFFQRAVLALTRLLPARREGVFELDLQLRPHGKDGPLAASLPRLREYYSPGGGAAPFERQSLVRLRPCTGDPALIAQVSAIRDRFTYGPEPFDLAASLVLRGKQLREQCRAGWINAKYSPGGLVEVEYTIQYLQLKHGSKTLGVRHPNILAALEALEGAGALTVADAARLRAAYVKLRRVINALRVERGNARDLDLPAPGTPAAQVLARRLAETPENLYPEINGHMARVAEQFRARFGSVT